MTDRKPPLGIYILQSLESVIGVCIFAVLASVVVAMTAWQGHNERWPADVALIVNAVALAFRCREDRVIRFIALQILVLALL